MHDCRIAIWTLNDRCLTKRLPRLDPLGDVDELLPEAALRREGVALLFGRPRDHRLAEPELLARRRLAGEHAEVAQHVREAALGDAVRRRRHLAAAAELGRDDDLALALRLADEQAR